MMFDCMKSVASKYVLYMLGLKLDIGAIAKIKRKCSHILPYLFKRIFISVFVSLCTDAELSN